MIVAWNSLMISGLARAASVFQNREYLELAARPADFILTHQWLDGRFHRVNYDGQASVLAQSEDYALFIKALLDLHQAIAGSGQWTIGDGQGTDDGQHRSPAFWLENAVKVQDEFDEFLWSLKVVTTTLMPVVIYWCGNGAMWTMPPPPPTESLRLTWFGSCC